MGVQTSASIVPGFAKSAQTTAAFMSDLRYQDKRGTDLAFDAIGSLLAGSAIIAVRVMRAAGITVYNLERKRYD